MATIITRLYETDAAARSVVSDLKAEGFNDRSITMVSGSDSVERRLRDAEIGEDSAAAYAPLIEQGRTLVAVKAMLGWADTAVKTVDRHDAVDAGLSNENVYVPTTYSKDMSKLVMSDHPLMLTSRDQIATDGPFAKHYGDFLFPLLSRREPPDNAVYKGTKRFGDFLMPLISKRTPPDNAVYHGTKRFGAFLVPLLSKQRDRQLSVFRGTVRFADFLAPLIIRR